MSACVNASGLRDEAMDILGMKEYFEDVAKACQAYKDALKKTPLELVWGDGMEVLGKGWERLCLEDVRPNEGLVFDLNAGPSVKL